MSNDPCIIVIGASAGGSEALEKILFDLPADYRLPVLVVQHLHSDDRGAFARNLDRRICLSVVTPCDKQKIERGKVYVAPADYHMLVERTGHIALSLDKKVKWSRPSIDILFQSAAYAWDERVIAVLLTGANDDGTEGMHTIRSLGGLTIAQDPATAGYPVMPQFAIDAGAAEKVLALEDIAELLVNAGCRKAGPMSDDR